MSGLLVSVRSVAEARLALEAGVDLVDVKEPKAGSLGKPEVAVAQEIAKAVRGQRPVSVATGELIGWYSDGQDLSTHDGQIRGLTAGFDYAKCGLAACGEQTAWRDWLKQWITSLASGVGPIAVAYADAKRAAAPHRWDVLQAATDLGCAGLLVDTYHKGSSDLFSHWTLPDVAVFIDCAREVGLRVVIGGSLNASSIAQLLPLEPDYVAVRGAACRGARHSALDFDCTRQLVELVASQPAVRSDAPAGRN